MTKREELYYLLKFYKKGEYDIETFCDELTRILYYESGAINELQGGERDSFEALGNIAIRFSPYKNDHKMAPGAYSSEEEVHKAIEVACKKLLL